MLVEFVDMTNTSTVSDTIGAAVKAVRTRHGWTQADLAAQCASIGAPHLTAAVIYDIESGRRDAAGRRRREISTDEWLALALALDAAPVHLAVPLEDSDTCQLTDTVSEQAGLVRQWVRGVHPLGGTDRRVYYMFVPEADLRRGEQLAQLIDVGLIEVITGREEEEDS